MKNIQIRNHTDKDITNNVDVVDNSLSDDFRQRKVADIMVNENSDIEIVRVFRGDKEYIIELLNNNK